MKKENEKHEVELTVIDEKTGKAITKIYILSNNKEHYDAVVNACIPVLKAL